MSFKRIILISRPLMWSWTALMYLVGIGSFSHFSFLAFVELVLFTFPFNLYLYGINDIYDVASDRINERKDGVQGIAPKDEEIQSLKKVVWIPPLLLFLVSLISYNLEHILIVVLAIFLAFVYSYKHTRFKEIPFLDCITSAIGYCIPALAAYSLHASISTIPITVFLIILPYMGIHAVTTLLDDTVDAASGMTTIGVVLKKRGTILFSIATFFISLIVFRNNIFLTSIFLVSLFLQVIFMLIDEKKDTNFRFALGAVLVSFGMLSMVYYILMANIITPL